jgi:hypothetical protein
MAENVANVSVVGRVLVFILLRDGVLDGHRSLPLPSSSVKIQSSMGVGTVGLRWIDFTIGRPTTHNLQRDLSNHDDAPHPL